VSKTVLVCDDAMFMRAMIVRAMNEAGFTVIGEAETGKAAVERYEALRPDLVTLDVVMPEMSGIQAARAIIAFDPDARILMCSAMGQDRLVAEATHIGVAGFIVKPFDGTRLAAEARRIMHPAVPAGGTS